MFPNDSLKYWFKGKGHWPNVSDKDWLDWRWQMKNRIKTADGFSSFLNLSKDEKDGLKFAENRLSVAVTPYFFNLMDPSDSNCPIRKQVIPVGNESVYKPEEVKKLHWDKKRRISKVWRRGQREINAWKQTLCNKKVNAYLSKTFKSSPTAQYIVSIPADEILDDFKNTFTFKDLGITYEDVVLKFLSIGLLPKNYFTLSPNEHQKSIK